MSTQKEIIIGCMSWGAWGKELSTSSQAELIRHCMDNGNSTFDHADIYGDYTTEAEFGKALIKSGVDRDDLNLITKCGIQYDGKSRTNRVKHYDYSKEYIIWSAEKSLKNLQTDYLDTFLLHRPSPLMHPDEIAEAVNRLEKSGKIRQFGVSNFTPAQVSMISDRIEVSVNQIEFSLTQHALMYDGTLDQMIEKQIRGMCWSPLGEMFKKETEQVNRIGQTLSELEKKYETSSDVLLLAWILKHPAALSPLIGTTSPDRIQSANKAIKLDLELEDWFILLKSSQGHKVP